MSSLIEILRQRRTRRVAFWCFAAALFIATHWPKLRITGPVPRPDLVMHIVAFSLWAILLGLTEYAGTLARRATWLFLILIGAAYAAIDEGLQAVPFVHRTARWDDYAANLVGICTGTVLLACAMKLAARRRGQLISLDPPRKAGSSMKSAGEPQIGGRSE